jgi:hypothetical protein
MGRLALLICVALLSAAMANGTRPAAGTVVATTPTTTAGVVRTPPAAAAADSKRKVPNGPDPIHNRYYLV